MNTTQQTTDLANALRQIIKADDQFIYVTSQEAADEISQLFLDAGKGGPIYGPYLQPIDNYPKRVWQIEK